MKRGTTALLVGLDVLLACLLAWLWIDPHGGLRGVHWQPPAAIRPELGTVSQSMAARDDADVARFMVILDRPVFSTTRRPPPPPKPVVVAPPDPLNTIRLYGLFSGTGGGGVIAQVEGKTRRVKVSEAIGDWHLKEIRAQEVVFARGGETRVVPLVQAKQAAGAAVPPPVFAAPVMPAAAGGGLPFPSAPAVPVLPTGAPASPPAQPPVAAPSAPGAKPAATATPKSPFVIGGSR